jgi:hypothetical protein
MDYSALGAARMYRSLYSFYIKRSRTFQYVFSFFCAQNIAFLCSLTPYVIAHHSLTRQNPRFALQTINNPIEDPLLVVDPDISQIRSSTSIELEIHVEVESESMESNYEKKIRNQQ